MSTRRRRHLRNALVVAQVALAFVLLIGSSLLALSFQKILAVDPAAKVAMVTAMGQQAIVMEALKAGAKDFVLKPFQPDRVLNALRVSAVRVPAPLLYCEDRSIVGSGNP